jgi:hypothetical protein
MPKIKTIKVSTAASRNADESRVISYVAYEGGQPKRYIFEVPIILPHAPPKSKIFKGKGEHTIWLRNVADTTIIKTRDGSYELLPIRLVKLGTNSKKKLEHKEQEQSVLCLPYGWGGFRGYVVVGYRNEVLAQTELYVLDGGNHNYQHLF